MAEKLKFPHTTTQPTPTPEVPICKTCSAEGSIAMALPLVMETPLVFNAQAGSSPGFAPTIFYCKKCGTVYSHAETEKLMRKQVHKN